jgi:NAD+ synthase
VALILAARGGQEGITLIDEAAKISAWIQTKVKESGAKGVVVGLSGGIDSSLVAVLSKQAVGDHLRGLIMPCHSIATDVEHAEILARKFSIRKQRIDLAPVNDLMVKLLPEGNRMARANLRPRLRMITLYYFANTLGYLVARTDNKTESFTGYFTKHGDGGVDILPISHLLKRQVTAMTRELGVPEEIITKPPSAGLWEGQTDEGEMGMTYEELDTIIAGIESGNIDGLDPALVEKAKRMHASSEHKRRLPPSFPG